MATGGTPALPGNEKWWRGCDAPARRLKAQPTGENDTDYGQDHV
jgi:hypothetical protein